MKTKQLSRSKFKGEILAAAAAAAAAAGLDVLGVFVGKSHPHVLVRLPGGAETRKIFHGLTPSDRRALKNHARNCERVYAELSAQ